MMRLHPRLLALTAILATSTARPGQASVPVDTIRAGQCSSSAMTDPDTTAEWFKVLAVWSRETRGIWSNDALRRELLELATKDQAVRQGITPDSVRDAGFLRRMRATDSANTERMRSILAQYGWPGKSLVGARGAQAAFLLVQHSRELGPEALALMEAAPPGEVSPADLALIDRQRRVPGGHRCMALNSIR